MSKAIYNIIHMFHFVVGHHAATKQQLASEQDALFCVVVSQELVKKSFCDDKLSQL